MGKSKQLHEFLVDINRYSSTRGKLDLEFVRKIVSDAYIAGMNFQSEQDNLKKENVSSETVQEGSSRRTYAAL